MTWKGERQRHSLSARGISNKENLLKQRDAINKQLRQLEEKIHIAKLPELVENTYELKMQRLIEDGLESLPLTDEEWSHILDGMDASDFVHAFYDNSYYDMFQDNPMIIDFFIEHWDAETILDYKGDAFEELREDKEKYENMSDAEIWEDLDSRQIESIINQIYDSDKQYMMSDNPGIMEDLIGHWMDYKPYEEEARQYANENGMRLIDEHSIEKQIIEANTVQVRAKALKEHNTTEEELDYIKRIR